MEKVKSEINWHLILQICLMFLPDAIVQILM